MTTLPSKAKAAPNLSAVLKGDSLLEAGLDLINQGLTVMNAELKLVAWNHAFLELLDFPAELAYTNASLEEFIRFNALRGEYGPGDIETQVSERMIAASSFQSHRTERMRPNGRIIEIRGEPLPGKGFITIYTDVTEQRHYEALIERQNLQLEQRVTARTAELVQTNERLREANRAFDQVAIALRQSEERMRLITDAVPALIAYVDRDLGYRFANKGYADWFGLSKDEIIGRTVRDVAGETVLAAIRPHLERAAGGVPVSYEYSMQRHDGHLVQARSSLVPDFNEAGEVVGLFVLSFDITEEKSRHAALVQAQKMEAVGQLTGGLAHDFNNLLTIIIGNLAVLRERHAEMADVKEFVEPALQASRRGVELIKRLLTFSRQSPLEPYAFDVNLLVSDVCQLLRRSLPESIRVTTLYCEGGPHVLADPHQLENALINVMVNARDAMPDGGELRVEISSRHLEAEAARELDVDAGEYVAISVSDSGRGMDKGTLARAIEPFFSTKAFGTGSGLGLSMVYGFVKQSRGGMRLNSETEQGTTILIALPRVAADPQPMQQTPDATAVNSEDRPLVLLVEDQSEVRRVIRLQLTELGYPVVEAHNGTEAARLIEDVPDIRILVTDVVMPGGLDGHALAQLARRLRPALRVVFVSGYTANLANDAPEDNGIAVLAKPFGKEQIAAAIARA